MNTITTTASASKVRSHAAVLVCPKCKMLGCDCVLPEPPKASPADHVCTRCHRSQEHCKCASHMVIDPVPEDENGNLRLRRDTPTARIESAVREAMHYHLYTRDAVALAALVRDLASRAYRV